MRGPNGAWPARRPVDSAGMSRYVRGYWLIFAGHERQGRPLVSCGSMPPDARLGQCRGSSPCGERGCPTRRSTRGSTRCRRRHCSSTGSCWPRNELVGVHAGSWDAVAPRSLAWPLAMIAPRRPSAGGCPGSGKGALTWDQGGEMAWHAALTMATKLPFTSPHSQWERGSNRSTN